MKIKYTNCLVIFLLIVVTAGCQKFRVRIDNFNATPEMDLPVFRANSARAGNTTANLTFPMQPVWTFRPTGMLENVLILVDSALYFGTLDGYIYIVDIETSKKLAKKKFRFASTCAYSGHNLIVARRYGDDTLFNYDLNTGNLLWKIDAGDVQTEPLIDGEWIYIAALYKHIDRYSKATGEKSWTFETSSQLRSSPALAQNLIVAGSDDGIIYALDSETGEKKWTFEADGAIYATPVIHQNTVFVGTINNHFYALNLETGELKWQVDTGGKIFHPCAVKNDLLVFGANDYYMYCLTLDGELKWKFPATSIISTAPVIAQDYVIFGSTDKYLYAVNLISGKEVWKFETQGRIHTSPIVYGDYLFAAAENNYLYAFRPENQIAEKK